MKLSEIGRQIRDIINNFTYVVDQRLLDALEHEWNIGSYSNRENVDALALEEGLKIVGKAKVLEKLPDEKYQWRHDWAFTDTILIELKRRPLFPIEYPNICIKRNQIVESYNLKQLTHIVGYTQNIENNYNIGDKLTFNFEGISTVKDVYRQTTPSNKKGKYSLFRKDNFTFQ